MEPMLLPMPRKVMKEEGRFELRAARFIQLTATHARQVVPAAKTIQRAVREATGIEWEIAAGDLTDEVAISIGVDGKVARPQGYVLHIGQQGISIVGNDPAGAFYGAQTLAQLMRQYGGSIPAMKIEDWPDFPNRGYMQDISRDKVPTMATLFALVDQMAELKMNQLQLYTEHTFAYRRHGAVWAQASPMTGEEILELDAYCRERFIELVPNQNSFGHMERWLKHPAYESLAECPEGFTFPWGARHEGGFSLNPLDPASLKLVEGLFDELLPHFSSGQFNVGCDETFDVGLGKSKEECAKRGKERVYLDFLLKIHRATSERGKVMQFWGDIILHKPELIGELPKDMIALNWGYDWNHPFEKETKAFGEAGVPFYVAPGTSSWLSISGRTDNAIENLKSAARHGLKNGATGYLNTDWGDYGHLQYWPVSWLGMSAGAAYSWCLESNVDVPMAEAIGAHLFKDRAGVMGKIAFDLGNVYQAIKEPMGNSTRLFWALVGGEDRKKLYEKVTADEFEEAEKRIDAAIAPLDRARMDRADAGLIRDEYRNAAAMLSAGCGRGKWLLSSSAKEAARLAGDLGQVLGEHRRLWLARNRPGGLQDSTRRLEQRLGEYGAKRAGSAFS